MVIPFYNKWLQRQRKKNHDDLCEEMDQSYREYFTKFTRITKPRKLVSQVFSPADLNLERERRQTLTNLTPLDHAGQDQETDVIMIPTFCQGFFPSAGCSSDVLGFLSCISLKANSIQRGKFILPTMSSVGKENFYPTPWDSSRWPRN